MSGKRRKSAGLERARKRFEESIRTLESLHPYYAAHVRACWVEAVRTASSLVARNDDDPNFDENEYRRCVFEIALEIFRKILPEMSSFVG